MLRAMTRPTLLSILALLGLAACEPPPYDASEADDTGSLSPSIRVLFPESSTSARYCATFMVAVDVDNFVLSEEHYGGDPVEGEGHWHLLDGNDVVQPTFEEYAFIPAEAPLADGDHVLKAQLVGNNHQPFSPDIYYQVEITVLDGVDPESGEMCVGGGAGMSGY